MKYFTLYLIFVSFIVSAKTEVILEQDNAKFIGDAAKEMYWALNLPVSVYPDSEAGGQVRFKIGKNFRCYVDQDFYACDVPLKIGVSSVLIVDNYARIMAQAAEEIFSSLNIHVSSNNQDGEADDSLTFKNGNNFRCFADSNYCACDISL